MKVFMPYKFIQFLSRADFSKNDRSFFFMKLAGKSRQDLATLLFNRSARSRLYQSANFY